MKGELRWKLKLDSYFSICLYALSFIHNSWPQLKASDQQWKTLSTATSVQFRWHEPGLQYFQTAIKYLRYWLILIRVYGFKIRKKGNTKRPKDRNTSAAQNAPKCFMLKNHCFAWWYLFLVMLEFSRSCTLLSCSVSATSPERWCTHGLLLLQTGC